MLIATLHEAKSNEFQRKAGTISPRRGAFKCPKAQANGSSQHAPAAEKPAGDEPSVAEHEPQIRLREQEPGDDSPGSRFVFEFNVRVDLRPAVGEAREGAGVGPGGRRPRGLDVGEAPVAHVAMDGRPPKWERADPVRSVNGTPAHSANAQAALQSKLKGLQDAQARAARMRELPDGRIRYYEAERPAGKPGPTRGNSHVTEWNPRTGQVRTWAENYDDAGEVTRVHPKAIDGQQVFSDHYPPTGKELGQ